MRIDSFVLLGLMWFKVESLGSSGSHLPGTFFHRGTGQVIVNSTPTLADRDTAVPTTGGSPFGKLDGSPASVSPECKKKNVNTRHSRDMPKLLKRLKNADRFSMRIGPVEDCTKAAFHIS